jgi:hypothetical protein
MRTASADILASVAAVPYDRSPAASPLTLAAKSFGQTVVLLDPATHS